MNKLMMGGVALMLAGISTASFADGGNFFVNADAGQANYHIDAGANHSQLFPSDGSLNKSDSAGALRFGYRWHGLVDFGIEAGYVDLGQVNAMPYQQNNYPKSNIDRYQVDVKDRGWLLGGNLKYNINDSWYVSARGGLFSSKVDIKGAGNLLPSCPSAAFVCPDYIGFEQYDNSSSVNGEYLGVGGGYNLTPNFSLGLSVDYYRAPGVSTGAGMNGTDVNVALYSVSAEYRF